MWKTQEGSTGRLVQLCIAYFSLYAVFSTAVKYFVTADTGSEPIMHGMELLLYSTAGGNLLALTVVIVLGWYRLDSVRRIKLGPISFPSEYLYIIPSGMCTAVVIPTTTLMYMLKGVSVMVAMIIMRGSIILVSRLIDELQIRQGILKKKVYKEENLGVLLAMGAVSVHIFAGFYDPGSFDFLGNGRAMTILCAYVGAYSVRIYIMNYFKNTRGKGKKLDNKGFFAIEQVAAFLTIASATAFLYYSPELVGWADAEPIVLLQGAIDQPVPMWKWAVLAGSVFGMVAFFSVFIFMFKGRTATFAGLVNRLTSLVAGTASTLIFWLVFWGDAPEIKDWVSLGFIFGAVFFLSSAERKRAAELAAERAAQAA